MTSVHEEQEDEMDEYDDCSSTCSSSTYKSSSSSSSWISCSLSASEGDDDEEMEHDQQQQQQLVKPKKRRVDDGSGESRRNRKITPAETDLSKLPSILNAMQSRFEMDIHKDVLDNAYNKIKKASMNIRMEDIAKYARSKQVNGAKTHKEKVVGNLQTGLGTLLGREEVYQMNMTLREMQNDMSDFTKDIKFPDEVFNRDFPDTAFTVPFLVNFETLIQRAHSVNLAKVKKPEKSATTDTDNSTSKSSSTIVSQDETIDNGQVSDGNLGTKKQPINKRQCMRKAAKSANLTKETVSNSNTPKDLLTKLPPSISIYTVPDVGTSSKLPSTRSKVIPQISITKELGQSPQSIASTSNSPSGTPPKKKPLAQRTGYVPILPKGAIFANNNVIIDKPTNKPIMITAPIQRERKGNDNVTTPTPTRFSATFNSSTIQDDEDSVPKIVSVASQATSSRVNALQVQINSPSINLPTTRINVSQVKPITERAAGITNRTYLSMAKPSSFIKYTPIQPKPTTTSSLLKNSSLTLALSNIRSLSSVSGALGNQFSFSSPTVPRILRTPGNNQFRLIQSAANKVNVPPLTQLLVPVTSASLQSNDFIILAPETSTSAMSSAQNGQVIPGLADNSNNAVEDEGDSILGL